ncbi:MAG: carbohydrate ABC transporter permease [Anaerolineae bacterium]|nr:carbohydrate ABC transporter permease [Anaerolineae bacterium]
MNLAMGFEWTKSRRKAAADIVTYILLFVLGTIILIPVFWMLSTALKADSEVFLFPPEWIPKTLHWDNFRRGLTFLPFGRYFLNTSTITLAAIIGQLLSSPLVAYAFARLRARGKNVLFMLILGTMMLPSQVTMIPVFVLFKMLGWVDTFIPLILPNFFGSAYFIFLLRQFFLTIPPELADAAKIDGCGYFGTYSRIYLPLSKPALATMVIFTFMWNWNDFMNPLIYLSSSEKWTLTLGLSRFTGMYGMTAWNLLMAASLVTILPCVVLFFFAQRYFIQGIVITGVKG